MQPWRTPFPIWNQSVVPCPVLTVAFHKKIFLGRVNMSGSITPPYASFWRRQWNPTPVLLPGKFHGQRSLEGCSPWGCWGLDKSERLHFHISLSCIGEGNGNPLQCSCLENPRDVGAWWAAVYGVAQSRIPLKRLSSSSSSIHVNRYTPQHTFMTLLSPSSCKNQGTSLQLTSSPLPACSLLCPEQLALRRALEFWLSLSVMTA